MKRLLIVAVLVIGLITVGCSGGKKLSEEQAVDLMNEIYQELEAQDLGLMSGWVDRDNGKTIFNYEIKDDDQDVEALKEEIYDRYGHDFELNIILIPFPTEPMIRGIVRDIKNNEILIVSTTNTNILVDGSPYYNALWVTTNEKTEYVDAEGKGISFDAIRIGMEVESYNRGMVLETYPGQSASEKIVMIKRNGIRPIKEVVSEAEYKNKYMEANISEGLYMIDWLVLDNVNLDEDGQVQLSPYVDYGYEYYDYEDLDGQAVLYEVKCFFFIEGLDMASNDANRSVDEGEESSKTDEDKIAAVETTEVEIGYFVEKILFHAGEQLVVEDRDGDGLKEIILTVWKDGVLGEEAYEIQEDGSIEGMTEVIF